MSSVLFDDNTQGWLSLDWQTKNLNKSKITGLLPLKNCHTPFSAVQYTVSQIKKNYPPPYYLCCTAGVDSQAMIHAWLVANNFDTGGMKVVSFIYNEDCNQYDMEGLQEICNRHDIKRQCINFDLMSFINSGSCLEYQKKYYTQSPQMAAHIKMFQMLPAGTVLMSGELTEIGRCTSMIANHFSVYKYARENNLKNQNKKFIPFFFEHDNIIGTAHWENIKRKRQYINLLNLSNIDRLRDYKIKCAKYIDAGYPVIAQTKGPEGRCSGFYKFKELYENTHTLNRQAALKYVGNYAIPSQRMFDINLRYATQDFIIYNHQFTVELVNQ